MNYGYAKKGFKIQLLDEDEKGEPQFSGSRWKKVIKNT